MKTRWHAKSFFGKRNSKFSDIATKICRFTACSLAFNIELNVRRFKQRSASRDLHGYAGETGVNYNQTDFCVVQGLYMSVHYNALLPVRKLYVLLRVEGWATREKPTTTN